MLALLPLKIWAHEILSRFTVRIHSRIVEKGRSWARLWYLLRGLDSQGSGYLRLPLVTISHLLEAGSSSVYQWLREGKNSGAFRWWKCQRGILRVAIGGLFAVAKSLGLSADSKKRVGISPWGVTSEVGLHQVLSLQSLRAAATASTAQRLQQLSRFAAWRKLPPAARKTIRLPQPDDFFQGIQTGQFSDDSASGNLPRCCIHIGKRRAWVSRGFVPFGTSQNAIALERGLCDRTIRRHLQLLKIDRRQIVQSKAEYKVAAECLNHDAGGCEISESVSLRSSPLETAYYLNEEGLGGLNTIRVGDVGFTRISSRFFTYGKKPKVWLYRCNIYQPSIKLCTMSAARGTYERYGEAKISRGTTPLQPLNQRPDPEVANVLQSFRAGVELHLVREGKVRWKI